MIGRINFKSPHFSVVLKHRYKLFALRKTSGATGVKKVQGFHSFLYQIAGARRGRRGIVRSCLQKLVVVRKTIL